MSEFIDKVSNSNNNYKPNDKKDNSTFRVQVPSPTPINRTYSNRIANHWENRQIEIAFSQSSMSDPFAFILQPAKYNKEAQ